MMKQLMGLSVFSVLAVVGAVALAAAEPGPEVDRVSVLEQRVIVLEARMKLLERRVGDLAIPVVVPKPQAAQPQQQSVGRLEGRDLMAWKLAHTRVSREFDRLGRQVSIPSARGPTSLVLTGEPTHQYMRKTATDDYLFRFHIGWFVNERQTGARTIDITIVDFGTELRVESMDWSTP